MEDVTRYKESDSYLDAPSSLAQQRTDAIRMEECFLSLRKEAEQQLRQTNRLNKFSLLAVGSLEANQILRMAIEILFDLFPLEQGVGFLMDGSKQYKVVSVVALPGREPIGVVPCQSLHSLPVHPNGVVFLPRVLRKLEQYDKNLGSFLNCMDVLFEKEASLQEEIVVSIPLSNKNGDPLGMLLAQRTNTTNISHHETLPSDRDVPFFSLIARHVEATLENAFLHKELSLFTKQLEEKVALRTAQLENTNKELEAFSYSASHDLRAPLRAINSLSQILISDYLSKMPSEAQHFLRLMQSRTQKMDQLIQDLLSFSRLGRQPLKKEPVAIAEIVRNAFLELHGQLTARQVEIKISDLPIYLADPALLTQVFINLISNALKYSRLRDAATIEVGCQNETSEGDPVFFVKDNGVGFDLKYAHKLFHPFERLHSADEYEGSGIGLAIVHGIIERHGGRIWTEAQVDVGATFFFTIGKDATP
ncbi:MAG: ATP-binding protein, partial [Nitrospirota bacterium]